MFEKIQKTGRLPSLRLSGWDYGSDGIYFITICTESRLPHFGQIQNGEMVLTEAGVIAKSLWNEIPNQFPFILIDKFVIMPDHLHGILTIRNNGRNAGARLIAPLHSDHTHNDPNERANGQTSDHLIQNHNVGGITGMKNPMLHNNISRVIRWYKGRCTFEIRKAGARFEWQRRFYDRIVRDNVELNRIRKYIEENPLKWDEGNMERFIRE